MLYGDQWDCSCGWSNFVLRKACRSCGTVRTAEPSVPFEDVARELGRSGRHYGLKVGDVVEECAFGSSVRGEVIDLPATDNNRAVLRLADGAEREVVAEWCRPVLAPA